MPPTSRDPRRERALPYGTKYHTPVLVREAVDMLVTDPNGIYVDGTLGGGGHSEALLHALDNDARLFGIDQDSEALNTATERLASVSANRFTALHGNFAEMESLLVGQGVTEVDGILLDLGVSSHQINVAERGFAFGADGPLDMRMDTSTTETAADVLNHISESELTDLLRTFGEEPRARRISRAIVAARPLTTTAQLADVVRSSVPFKEEVKSLSRVFQAIRIYVNDELVALRRALISALRLLKPGGRLVVIAYHSLEDRPVKQFLKYGNFNNQPVHDFYGNLLTPWEMVTRHVVQPDEDEVAANPRSRSARLRVAIKRDPEESGLGTVYDYPTPD